MNFSRISRRGTLQSTIAKFNDAEKKNEEELKRNPFSKTYEVQKFDKKAGDYARPAPGSKTEKRASKAGDYVTREVVFLCEIISQNAIGQPPDCTIKFGPLFYIYSHYSGSLVGMLIIARKYGLVDFQGEMLYQRQDDHKEIRLLKPIDEIRKIVQYSGDPVNCISIVKH
uniref:Costars domain-containing protein n=1 Tax=Panagrolaimus sp. JU765 TaxID=591449 RepID=A0AC34QH95_9BILA